VSESERRRLEALYEQHSAAILSYALRATGSMGDAQEVCSETFLIAWRKISDVPEQDPVLWLYSVAKNVVYNQTRSQRRRGLLQSKVNLAQDVVQGPADASIELRVDLQDALGRLKATHRQALILSYWQV
jgi:RNA polymerase sigma factor (sigma-70 family)